MEIPTNFDMNMIIPILQSMGVSPQNLGPDKMAKLQNLAESVQDPSKITEEMSRKVLNILGISPRGNQSPIIRDTKKVGRNEACPCRSGQKYKKCCGKNS